MEKEVLMSVSHWGNKEHTFISLKSKQEQLLPTLVEGFLCQARDPGVPSHFMLTSANMLRIYHHDLCF